MNMVFASLRSAIRLAALSVAAVSLAGCMIVSDAPLVPESEGAQPLPATAYLLGYNGKDGVYEKGTDAPLPFTLTGNTYVSADGSIKVIFAPIADGEYLLALDGSDGSMYGTATLRDHILTANMIIGNPDVADIVKADPALAGASVEEGGIKVSSRAELDRVVAMSHEGKLQLGGLVLYVLESADASGAPAKLVSDGAGGLKAE